MWISWYILYLSFVCVYFWISVVLFWTSFGVSFPFCGQIVHETVYDEVLERLKKAYAQVKIGDPLDGIAMCNH